MSTGGEQKPTTDILLTAAGVFVIVALVVFFAVEMTNPSAYVLQDRTIYILLGLIAALLGFNQFQGPVGSGGGYDFRQGGGNGNEPR